MIEKDTLTQASPATLTDEVQKEAELAHVQEGRETPQERSRRIREKTEQALEKFREVHGHDPQGTDLRSGADRSSEPKK